MGFRHEIATVNGAFWQFVGGHMRRFFWFLRNLAILSNANGFATGYFPQDLNQGFRQVDFRHEVATVNEAFWGRIVFFLQTRIS